MFRVQKKLERHLIYRGWVLARAAAYCLAVGLLLRSLIPAALRSDFSAMGPVVGGIGSVFGIWLVFEFAVEKLFAFQQRPKKKKGEEKKKERRATPRARIFYRRVTLRHLLPGQTNPVLLGLSEQDQEYVMPFRVYLAVRYLIYVGTALVTLMVLASDPVTPKSWPGEGYLGALIPFFALRIVESSLLYLFLGKVMSGEDIHGSKTTRFFAFEPTASFTKRLTLPVIDRKGWMVSLHPFRSRWPKVLWWMVRLSVIVATVMLAEAANSAKLTTPRLIPSGLSVLIPFSLIYFCTAFERALAYLIFFPTAKKKKKADDTSTKTVEYRSVG